MADDYFYFIIRNEDVFRFSVVDIVVGHFLVVAGVTLLVVFPSLYLITIILLIKVKKLTRYHFTFSERTILNIQHQFVYLAPLYIMEYSGTLQITPF